MQAEDGIRDLVRSRGLGDVYKSQDQHLVFPRQPSGPLGLAPGGVAQRRQLAVQQRAGGRAGRCLLYTSDAADERSSVDLGGRRIIKTKKNKRYVNRKT